MGESASLSVLIEQARRVRMTPEDIEAQKLDFAYGNTKIENDAITKEMIAAAAKRVRDAK